jgi:hypothetical protein
MTRTQTDREALLADILGDIQIAEKQGHDTDILHVTAHQLRREIAELAELADAFLVRTVESLDNGRYRVTIDKAWTFADGSNTADVRDLDEYKHTWVEPLSYTGRQSKAAK